MFILANKKKKWKDCVHVIEKREEWGKMFWQVEFKDRKRKDHRGRFTPFGFQTFLLLWSQRTFLIILSFAADWEQSDISCLM